jgi:hypothetical protein
MAKSQTTHTKVLREVSRPGVHAKTKTSTNKNSRNYRKPYGGQGK